MKSGYSKRDQRALRVHLDEITLAMATGVNVKKAEIRGILDRYTVPYLPRATARDMLTALDNTVAHFIIADLASEPRKN